MLARLNWNLNCATHRGEPLLPPTASTATISVEEEKAKKIASNERAMKMKLRTVPKSFSGLIHVH